MISAPHTASTVTTRNAGTCHAPKNTVTSPTKFANPGNPPAPGPPPRGERHPDKPQFLRHPAEFAHLERAGLIVNVAAQPERQRREEAVRDHDDVRVERLHLQ